MPDLYKSVFDGLLFVFINYTCIYLFVYIFKFELMRQLCNDQKIFKKIKIKNRV